MVQNTLHWSLMVLKLLCLLIFKHNLVSYFRIFFKFNKKYIYLYISNYSFLFLESSCVVIKNLEFCDEVFYSVPKTVSKNTETDLAIGYDNLAKSYFNNFTLTIGQYPCNDIESKYSLVRNCNDCEVAYKNWICAITIPRCASEDSNNGKLRDKPRIKISDQSMNINQPFTELAPCVDLCYNLTRSCPASFGFRCPDSKIISTYGDAGSCNSLGMDVSFKLNAAIRIRSSSQWTILIIIFEFIILIVGI